MEKKSLLDQALGGFGLVRRSTAPPETTLGASGTAVFGGYIVENEKQAALTGIEKYRTYSNILANTSIVAAGTRYFLNLLTSAAWKVEPADGEGVNKVEAERFAELIDSMMNDMNTPWHRVVRRAAMYRFYGFSIQEWTAKRRDDGALGMLDIAPRPQITIQRWDMDTVGDVLGVIQRNPQNQQEIYLPRSKIIYLVDDSLNDSPEGLGLFRNVVDSSRRLARYEQLEGYGFETDLRGIPIVRIPYAELSAGVKAGRVTEEEATKAIAEMEGFIAKHIKNPQLGVALDSLPYQTTDDSMTPSAQKLWDINLLSGDGANFEAMGSAIERVNHEIARVLGVEQLLLGQSRGTQSLSRDKSDNFALIIDSTLLEIQEQYDKDFVERLFDLNGWDKAAMPSLKTDKIQHREIAEVTQSLKELAQAGAALDPMDPAIDEIREQIGLPPSIPVVVESDVALPNDNQNTQTGSEEET